jgi:hypothetical protein
MRYTPIVSVFHLLRSKHAYPLFVIKGNEPTLQVDLATYFADPYAQFQQAETVDRRRGRVQRRTILVSSQMGSYRRSLLAWGHSCRPTDALSHRKGPDHRRSRLPHRHPPSLSLDGPPSLLTLSRRHWGIENSLHYVRDVTFAEDRSRIRTAHAPQLLAACRNLAITLIHRSGSSLIAASRRSFSYHPRTVFDLLLSRASPQQ